jgi:hypothetical protein
MKLLLIPTLVSLLGFSCPGGGQTIEPDLGGDKPITVYFLLGFLDEYRGRSIVEGSALVEKFGCDEQKEAELFLEYLRRLTAEQQIRTEIEVQTRQECLVSYSSREVARFLNSFYRYELSDEVKSIGDDGTYERTANAFTTMEAFPASCRECKLAYLSGAYTRYGVDDSFWFANSQRKAALVAELLRDLGCRNVRIESSEGLIPQSNRVIFEPSPEVAEWLGREW